MIQDLEALLSFEDEAQLEQALFGTSPTSPAPSARREVARAGESRVAGGRAGPGPRPHRSGLLPGAATGIRVGAAGGHAPRRDRRFVGLPACAGDGSTALDDLVAEITVGETTSSGIPSNGPKVRTRLLPPLLARGTGRSDLSAGCASGEEPYSAAILLRHSRGGARHDRGDRHLATRPRRARRAEYSDSALRNVPEDVPGPTSAGSGRHYELLPGNPARGGVRYLGLADGSPTLRHGLGEMDLVFCRTCSSISTRMPSPAWRGGCWTRSTTAAGWCWVPRIPDRRHGPCEVEMTGAG